MAGHGRGVILLVGLLVSAWTGALPAQDPAQRQALQRWRDSLAAVHDATLLQQWEEQGIAQARVQRDDAVLHLRLGFLALRLRELGSRRHLDHAVSEFEWALELQPDWPLPSYGLGLAAQYRTGRDGFAGGLLAILGLDGTSRALNAFETALARDSQFTEAAHALADASLDPRLAQPLDSVLVTIRRATRHTTDPDLLLVRGRLERLVGSPDSAAVVLARAAEHGGPRGVLAYELARTIPLVPVSIRQWLNLQVFDSLYYQGARVDDSVTVALYRDDLAPLVADSVLATFDRQQGDARADWLLAFWTTRAQSDLRAASDRLAEHMRRWYQARRDFTLSGVRRRYAAGMEIYRSGHPTLDDRGITLLRHGVPSRRIVWPLFARGPQDTIAREAVRDGAGEILALSPEARTQPAVAHNYGNETWIYRHPDGNMVLHFAANFDARDYRLQSSILGLDVAFTEILGTIYRGAELPAARRVLEADGVLVGGMLVEERVQTRENIRVATTTDRWAREYATALPGRAEWYRVPDLAGGTLGHLVYTIDARALRAQPWPQIPVTLRGAFLDAAGQVVASLDTTLMVDRPQPTSTYVAVRAMLPIGPAVTQVRVAAEITPDIGQLHATAPLRALAVQGLVLSDLLVGRSGESLRWDRMPGDTVWIDPQTSYRREETLDVWMEVHGVQPSAPYTFRLALTRTATGIGRLLGRRQATVTISGPVQFDRASGVLTRQIPLSAVEPGDYLLEVVLEGRGQRVIQQRRVYVVP